MNKKKLGMLLISVALIATVGVGATLAYFTDSESTLNTIETGNVNITLTEPLFSEENENNTLSHVVPNQVITKDPTITVEKNSQRTYVRAKIEVKGEKMTLNEKNDIIASIVENLNTGWSKGEETDMYYYNVILEPEGKTTIFDTIKIPATWNNTSADKKFEIEITAEAIQADWLEDDVIKLDGSNNIISWTLESDIQDYVEPVVVTP